MTVSERWVRVPNSHRHYQWNPMCDCGNRAKYIGTWVYWGEDAEDRFKCECGHRIYVTFAFSELQES